MHICFVTPEFVTESIGFDGGLANYLYRVSLSLIQLGHKSTVIVISDRDDVFQYNSINVHRIKKKKNYPAPLSWLYQSYLLNEYLIEMHRLCPFDIIQYTSYTATGLFRIDYVPCVVRISSIRKLSAINAEFPQDDINLFFEQMELYSIKKADSVFGPCNIISEEVNRCSACDVKIIESPYLHGIVKIDDKLYKEHLLGKKYLLFFGTIGILKGIAVLAEIISELLSQFPKLYFVFIGKDVGYRNQPMMDYVYEKAGELRERVIRFDKLHHDQLYPIIQGAYAVVLPSRIDNFPNTCIEAMAHGKMVIGTRNTGFDQLINDKISGFLCEKDNPIDLLKTIKYMMSISLEEKLIIEGNAKKRIDLLKPEIVVQELVDYYYYVITRFKEGEFIKRNDTDNIIAKAYFYSIQNLEEIITEKSNIITEYKEKIGKQDFLINLISTSYSFRIGKLLVTPLSVFIKFLKKK
jgi:glycosyltransferase involved in cell wall biosynthesis